MRYRTCLPIKSIALTVLLVLSASLSAMDLPFANAQRLLKEEKKDANALFSLSFYFQDAGRPFSALKSIERALEIDSKVPGYHARHGQLLLGRQRLKEAAKAYGKAADMDPLTKAFRAAEARALAQIEMYPESAASWEKLLNLADERKEILDAARSLAGIYHRLYNWPKAEAAWQTAYSKLKEWGDRLQAADRISEHMVAERAGLRAAEFWTAIFNQETDWHRRAQVAERLDRVAAHASAGSAKIATKARKLWNELVEDAKDAHARQRAAVAKGQSLLRDSKALEADAVVADHVFASDWSSNSRAVQVRVKALGMQGKQKEIVTLYRSFMAHEKTKTYLQKSSVANNLQGVLMDPQARLELRMRLAQEFPKELDALIQWKDVALQQKAYDSALKIYERILLHVQKQNHYDVSREYRYWRGMVDVCAKMGKSEQVIEWARSHFRNVEYTNEIYQWLQVLRHQCGELNALKVARSLAEMGSVFRFGCATYLNRYGLSEIARPWFKLVAQDKTAKVNLRRQAFQQLLNTARTTSERIEISMSMVHLGGTFWQRRTDYRRLVQYLAQDGRIEDSIEWVRKADAIRNKHSKAGPSVLESLGQHLFQGNRVGLGLRNEAGLRAAQAAAIAFYREWARRKNYQLPFQRLLSNLAELQARRGDYGGAVAYLVNACGMHEDDGLRIKAAQLLERKEDIEGAWQQYLAYADATCQNLQGNFSKRRNLYRSLPGLRHEFKNFVKVRKKVDAFEKEMAARMAASSGVKRETQILFLLVFHRNFERLEQMVSLLEKVKTWRYTANEYRNQMAWAKAAIKLGNAASRADAQRRDRLLKQLDQWKKRFAANVEDYQAAMNVYKTFIQLGRRKEGEPYLTKGWKVAVRDPLILERYGRELMLNKKYIAAAQAYEVASEITGRRADYEKSILSAYALSGNQKAALSLALDALEAGRNHGQGIQTVEQILDIAHRSDNKKVLLEEMRKRIAAGVKTKRLFSENFARLALRVAWDEHDAKLADAAVEELLRLANAPNHRWSNEYQLKQLAVRAKERGQLENAIRIWQALWVTRLARGMQPQVYEFKACSLWLVEAGKEKEASALMFDGLQRVTLAHLSQRQPAPPWIGKPGMPRQERSGRRGFRHLDWSRPQAKTIRQFRLPWIRAVLDLVAQEARSGASGFRKACGKRLDELLEYEFTLLKEMSSAYKGPLKNIVLEDALALTKRVTAVIQDLAVAKEADASTHMALATRYVQLVLATKSKAAQPKYTFVKISTACKSALECVKEKGRERTKAGIHIQIARLYEQLLMVPKEKRLEGISVDLVFTEWNAAALSVPARWGLDATRQCLRLSQRLALKDQHLLYAKKLSVYFPNDKKVAMVLVKALLGLGVGERDAAVKLLEKFVGEQATYAELRQAAQLMRSVQADAFAAGVAARFLARAVEAYLIQVGEQLDAQGDTLPDSTYGYLKVELALALADHGEPKEGFSWLLEAVDHLKGAALNGSNIQRMTKAFSKAKQIPLMIEMLQKCISEKPKDPALRVALATVYETEKNHSEAAKAFFAAKILKAELSMVKRLIDALRKAGDHETALRECRSWTTTFSSDAEGYKTLAAIYKDQGNQEGEVQALTMLLESAPREAGNCRVVAVQFAIRNDLKRARALLERAIELRSEEPYRHIDLAEVCLMSKEYERAEAICLKALSKDWTKGLSPELMARMPRWKGTYENRARSILAEAYDATKQTKEAARIRLAIPHGYKRPELENAVPTPVRRGRGRWPVRM